MTRKFMSLIYGLLAGLGIAGILAFWVLCLAGFLGWVRNIFQFVFMIVDGAFVTHLVLFVARGVGLIFYPLGAILGWF